MSVDATTTYVASVAVGLTTNTSYVLLDRNGSELPDQVAARRRVGGKGVVVDRDGGGAAVVAGLHVQVDVRRERSHREGDGGNAVDAQPVPRHAVASSEPSCGRPGPRAASSGAATGR